MKIIEYDLNFIKTCVFLKNINIIIWNINKELNQTKYGTGNNGNPILHVLYKTKQLSFAHFNCFNINNILWSANK